MTDLELLDKLNKLSLECRFELSSLGIPYSTNILWGLESAKSRWGLCESISEKDNLFKITIQKNLLEHGTDIGIKSIIIHELIHTCPNALCHTGAWKRYARTINNKYNEYYLERCAPPSCLGLEDYKDNYSVVELPIKYNVRCKECGKVIKYKKSGKIIKWLLNEIPKDYYASVTCPICGSNKLEVIKL